MTRVEPVDLAELEKAGDTFTAAVEVAMAAVVRQVADRMASRARALASDAPMTAASDPFMNTDDLQVIGSEWTTVVDGELLPMVEQVYRGSSVAWTATAQESVPGWDTAVVPPVSQAQVQARLAGARNRLVGIGDDLWGNARDQLQAGVDAGEGIPDLAARVRSSAGITGPRAGVVARTEVVSASNAGSIDTARMLGVDMGKVWDATGDARTRPSHAAADGQERPLQQPFNVGGAALDYPGDPFGPPGETVNCRCVVTYLVPDGTEPPQVAGVVGDDALASAPLNMSRIQDVEALPPNQLSALRQYKGTAFTNINDALRRERGEVPGSPGFDFPREITTELDDALGRSPLRRSVVVERGIVDGQEVFGAAWDRSLTGASWTEHAYVSTTTNQTVAREFAGIDGAVLQIRAPQGTRAIALSDANYESELLLERGLQLRVVGDTGPGPNRAIEAEVVG